MASLYLAIHLRVQYQGALAAIPAIHMITNCLHYRENEYRKPRDIKMQTTVICILSCLSTPEVNLAW